MSVVNGASTHLSKAPPPGIYVPTVATFTKDRAQDLDLEVQVKHAIRLANCGVTGLVIHGSNGEAVSLNHDERSAITRSVRKGLDEAGFTADRFPLIIGTGTQSVRETIQLSKKAKEDGGSYVIALPPSYFLPLMTEAALVDYFQLVANGSPLPVLIYNYPGVTQGIDLSSDILSVLARHPNIVGVKLTCGNLGKAQRLSADYAPENFSVFGGMVETLVPAMAAGASGAISGSANVVPKMIVKLYNLYREGENKKEQVKLQQLIALADWIIIKSGVVTGTKYALEHYYGYGGEPRKPLQPPTPEFKKLIEVDLKQIMEYEKGL